MAKHALGQSPSGLILAHYDDEAEAVILTAPTSRLWRFTLDGEGTLSQFLELAQAFPEADAPDLRWLADTLASVETWLETCPHDLARFGEVGVSY